MQLEQRDNRVGRDHQMPQDDRMLEERLDRMHRPRGPRAWVDRIVVDRMDPFVEDRHMDQAVDAEEVHFMDGR